MNVKGLRKLISLLPDGEKKKKLLNKLEELQAKQASASKGGLSDEFSLTPTGHIKIEAIDESGNVVGVLADQPNLVVNGAEEILLRAFSGDPERMLFKNRIPKGGSTGVYHVKLDKIIEVVNGQNVVPHHPNELWKAVNEDDFDVDYSYYPVTVYVKEEIPTEPGMKAFSITTTPGPNTAPLTSEVYSTFTNLFIGIGDGKDYAVSLDDNRLTFSAGFTGDASRKETSTLNDDVTFTEKISHFVVEFMKHNKGGQLEVYVDGVLKQTIETYDSSLADGVEEPASVEISVDATKETSVRLKFSGSDPSVTNPKIILTGIRFDAFTKDMNSLIGELPTFTTKFDTPAIYNTTTVAPYTIQLEHYPVIADSVVVEYAGNQMQRVTDFNQVTEGKFFVDEMTGKVYFNRALTGLSVTYEITGEIHEDEIASSLTTVQINVPATETLPSDGSTRTFTLSHNNLVPNSVFVTLNGVTLNSPADYTVNHVAGTITLTVAPAAGSTVSVAYEYKEDALKYELDKPIKDSFVRLFDQNRDELTLVDNVDDFTDAVFLIDTNDANRKTLLVHPKTLNGNAITRLDVYYKSDAQPGVPTNYKRQVILKPKIANEYPWFELDKGSVQFVAEFKEGIPNYNVTIREMGLFDGPRVDDEVTGYKGYPVKAFSLVRVGETRKEVSTGIRVTWTITLLNEHGQPFKGGF
jgi:hypothetical protein